MFPFLYDAIPAFMYICGIVSFSLSFKVTLGIFAFLDAFEDALATSLVVLVHVFELVDVDVDDRVDDGDVAEVDVCRILVDDSVLVCWCCALLVVESGSRKFGGKKGIESS